MDSNLLIRPSWEKWKIQMNEGKKIVIKLPTLRIRSFLTIRFFLVLTALFLSLGVAYWVRNIRPYLSLPTAHLNAFMTTLSSDADGRLVEMGPQEGSLVKKGDLLFALDRELLLAKYSDRKSSLDLLNKQIEFEKNRMIQAMDAYLAASGEVELGINAAESIQKHLHLMEEAQGKSEEILLKAAPLKSELNFIELEMKKATLSAPFNGIILRRYENEGAVVSFGDPIYILCDPDRMWIDAEVPEMQIGQVAIGTPARIWINAYPNKEFAGQISYVGPSSQAASIPIKISLQNKDPSLKPGLSAKVDLKVR